MVRFDVSFANFAVKATSQELVAGDKNIDDWVEHWCFQRSAAATTPADGGAVGDHCPQCGSVLDVDIAGVCRYCRTSLMGGERDWVLTQIWQVMERVGSPDGYAPKDGEGEGVRVWSGAWAVLEVVGTLIEVFVDD